MNPTFKRRFPTYMTGLLIGLAVFLVTNSLKKAFAPKFLEITERRPEIKIASGGSLRLRYAQEPGYFLVPGFPTELTAGSERQHQDFLPTIRLGYRELTEKETLVGPFRESGLYSMRGYFHICGKPGDAMCVKTQLLVPLVVGDEKAPAEAPLEIDLEVMLKAGLATQPAEAATPAPSQSK